MIGKQDYVTPKSGVRIAKSGVFNFDKLCNEIKSWGDYRRYDFTEKECNIKQYPRGKTVLLSYIFERKVDNYVLFTVQADFMLIGLRKVKVDKKQLDRAYMEIKIFAFMKFDYRGKWKSFLKEFLLNVYNNYLIKDKIKNVLEVKLYLEMMELHDKIKGLMDMYK